MKISVIVPVYQVEEYLPKCVDSILSQSYTDMEVILVDDGSPDSCGATCDGYAERDKRVRVIHRGNGGLAAARNSGIEAAIGEYIAFVDSDDWVDADYLSTLYGLVKETGCDIAQCAFRRVWSEEELPRRSEATAHTCTGEEMCKLLCRSATHLEGIVAWNKLFKRELFQKIRFPDGRIHEDEATTYRLFWAADKVAYTTQQLYLYRQREGSIVNSALSRKKLDAVTALQERADFYKCEGAKQLCALTLIDLCGVSQDLSVEAMKAGDEELVLLLRQKALAAYYQAMHSDELSFTGKLELFMKRSFPKLWKNSRELYNRIRGK